MRGGAPCSGRGSRGCRQSASHAPRSMQGTVCCSALHQWWHVVSAAWLAWRQQHMNLTAHRLLPDNCSWASSAQPGCVCLHRQAAVAVPAAPAQRLLPAGPQLQVLLLQANRVRGVLITQMYSFFNGNGIDVLLAPSIDYTSMGNLVGLPEAVVPIGFKPVSPGSLRQNPSTIGIYGLPYQDAKARQLPDDCSCLPVHCCQLCCAAARRVSFFCGLPCCCGFASAQPARGKHMLLLTLCRCLPLPWLSSQSPHFISNSPQSTKLNRLCCKPVFSTANVTSTHSQMRPSLT